MGKGVIDLPDVIAEDPGAAVDSPAQSGQEIAGVDDLLAQMAGEEIDRLLAEADATREALPPEKPAQKIPQVIPDPPPAVLPEPPASPPISPSSVDVVAAVLEALPTSPAAEDLESATTPAERSALDEPVAAALDAAAAASAAAQAPVDTSSFEAPAGVDQTKSAAEPLDADDDLLPLYLKPLVWLNSPLTLLPETVRELVGKVALLTLFNATAVLIYVVLFRKHH